MHQSIVAAAFFAVASCCAYGAQTEPEPRLTFGVVSDIHFSKPGDENYFVRALEYFRDHGADGVLCAGDLTESATVEQLERVAKCWFQVFPDGRAPDGRKVEQLFIYGNHDSDAWKWGGNERTRQIRETPELSAKYISVTPERRRETWEKIFREPYVPVWEKTVKGYVFVGAHCGDGVLGDYINKNGERIAASGKPFFCVQHAHLKGTTFGDWGWGHDSGWAAKALSKYPNAVAFAGHSHYSLTDERSIWQGAFTSLNAASLRYASHEYAMRDNGARAGGYTRWLDWRPRAGTSGFNRDLGQQGMLVTVTDGEIRFKRLEFHFGETLGPDWVVPLGKDAERPYDYATRKAARKAPEFAEDAVVKVEYKPGRGKDNDKGTVKVSFPSAQTVEGSRVFEYEATAIIAEDDIEIPLETHRFLANDMILAPSRAGKATNHIEFVCSRLPPKAHVRFAVRPCECFGNCGRWITSDGSYVTP